MIAGVRSLPDEAAMLAKSLRLSRYVYCKRILFPGVFPSLVTGVITAAGGAWNTSIVAEAVEWKGNMIYAHGLGAFIMRASRDGDSQLVCLGVVVMCVYVLCINRLIWTPLYRYVESRYGGK